MDIRWLAGFVDGDGSIGIFKTVTPTSFGFTAILAVYNTNLRVLHAIKRTYGGHINESSYNPKRQKVCYQLKWTGSSARNLISRLLPHLQLKQQVARVVLKLKARRRGDSPNALKRQLSLLSQVKKLNNRGTLYASRG